MKMLIKITLFCSLCFLFISCSPTPNPSPNAGFSVTTYAGTPSSRIPTAGTVNGQFLYAIGNTTGNLEYFNHIHNGIGIYPIAQAKSPARWSLSLGPDLLGGSLCLTYSTVERDVATGSIQPLYCAPRYFSFTASPNSIDALNPPATITFDGKGIDNLYGEPTLAFYDESGNVVASTQATQSLWSGNEIEGFVVSTPNISGVYDGIYTVVVHNVLSDQSWDVIGAATITIYGNPLPPIEPPPGGGGCEPPQPDMPALPCEPGNY